ncbi:DUF2334 domain-containing protein [Rubrobacter marinus]|uniref:DUF2334 domain-containing protein n=1 Tax=Rubrobacter marinus TaxID=2653852 RepID=A0A6G8Q2J7_9ACTN|nr:DUF2334 domain-containing protein [Rubrobacter marinus]QIN80537.1 DUF2334 domain-containing protein [Rubrobacter marinus]
MSAGRLRVLLVGLLLLVAGLPYPRAAEGAEGSPERGGEEGPAPGGPSVLIVNQEWPEWPQADDQIGPQLEMLLRHFTPRTTVVDAAEYSEGQLRSYDRVAVVGNDPTSPLPAPLLEDLARADRPVLWLGYGLDRLPRSPAYGFHLKPPGAGDAPRWVEYRGERYGAVLDGYEPVGVVIDEPSARVLASYAGSSPSPIPYVVRGGNLFYVNGLPATSTDHPEPELDGLPLVLADVLHEFFDTPVKEARQALIRLEDVSVHVDPRRIIEATDYLHSRRIPFSLGVIPAQRFKDGSVVALSKKPEFVRALRYAQDRGGTIILHGYHHTFGSGEDYEYWDEVRNAPLRGETWEKYAAKTEDGIRILRDQGLEPRFWETPHYAGSPLAYEVFSRYFSHAIENRAPLGWLPYPAGPDPYGQTLIPENLGYINPEQGFTVEAQLRRAEALRVVRDGWAVGFYHPANIPVSELEALVEGLQEQGYAFADLRAMQTEVRYDYRPGPLARATTWLKIDVGLYLSALNLSLERRSAWWPTLRALPWLTAVIAVMMAAFLLRLPAQWRSGSAASSLVEVPLEAGARGRSLRPPILLAALTAAVAVGFWASGGRENTVSASPEDGPLAGWSGMDWTVKYDGYGKVGVENGAAVLAPKAARRPVETHAALALAGDPALRDYSFEVRMKFEDQLRRNSPPNTWETGWVFFRYKAEDRSYYLVHKTNGLELGKLVPPKGTGQVFLATKGRPRAEPGRWYDYRIEVRGPTIRVYVDDELQITFTDPYPIRSGRVGLYTEDARVLYRDPTVTGLPPAP